MGSLEWGGAVSRRVGVFRFKEASVTVLTSVAEYSEAVNRTVRCPVHS